MSHKKYKGDNGGKKGKKRLKLSVPGFIGVSVFFLSFISYFLLMEAGLQGVNNGADGPLVLGWEAVLITFKRLCVIPVYPVCILYEIIFAVLYIRKRGSALKAVSAAVAIVTLVGISIPCINHEARRRSRIERNTPLIQEYLAGKYGISEDQILSIDTSDYTDYKVEVSILPGAGFFVFPGFGGGFADDTLLGQFYLQNGSFHDDFEDYLDEYYGMPDDMELNCNILTVNFEGYSAGGDYTALFPDMTYEISGIVVQADDPAEEDLMQILHRICDDIVPEFEAGTSNPLQVCVRSEEEDLYHISIEFEHDPERNPGNVPYIVIQADTDSVDGILSEERFYLGTE